MCENSTSTKQQSAWQREGEWERERRKHMSFAVPPGFLRGCVLLGDQANEALRGAERRACDRGGGKEERGKETERKDILLSSWLNEATCAHVQMSRGASRGQGNAVKPVFIIS